MQDSNESRVLWEQLADAWDSRMGETDNHFHREVIRPATLRLLEPKAGERILDAACGSGNFSRLLAGLGAEVVAFDYSVRMIENARTRTQDGKAISFAVADATDKDSILALAQGRPFDKAVANMAVMDISDIRPLFEAVAQMLVSGGVFVFSSVHPCFQTPNMRKITEVNDYTGAPSTHTGIVTYKYIEPEEHLVTILATNENQAIHYHRPLHVLLNTAFAAGFVLDGMEEPVFHKENTALFDWYDIPPAIILRLRKL